MRSFTLETYRHALLPAVMALSIGMPAPESAAALLEVEQSVFGMDCAPCAFGVERSLKKLEGVIEVNVSLNDGLVRMSLSPENRVTLTEIRKRILDNGFTPKEAIVRISGTIDASRSPLALTTAVNTRYLLSRSDSLAQMEWDQLNATTSGSQIVIRGRVEAGAKEPLPVAVLGFTQARNKSSNR